MLRPLARNPDLATPASWAVFAIGFALLVTPGRSRLDERSSSAGSGTTRRDELAASLRDPADTVPVIITLRDSMPGRERRDERRDAIRRKQGEILSSYSNGFTPSRRYLHIPALAGRLTRDALERLRHDPDVSHVQLDGRGRGQLKVAVPAIGADRVKSIYGLTGKGVRVAVLDTGVDTTHRDLSDAVVAQHCFTQYDCPPLRTAEGTSAEDDQGHGSNVTGIITSNGVVSAPGFAPDAEIVAVKVNDENDSGQESDWLAGLDWVYENLSTLKVNIVNFSLGTDAVYASASDCDSSEPAMAQAIQNFVAAGIPVFVASGNQGSSTSLSSPACNTGAIAVGATYDSSNAHEPPTASTYYAQWGGNFANCSDDATSFDEITCFTNSSSRLDLVAPGTIVSDTINGTTEAYWGTSQATPVAAGVAALMLQCNPSLSAADIKKAMVSTGVPVIDPKNGLSFPSLRALAAVRAVCPEDGGTLDVEGGAEGGADAGAADAGAPDAAPAATGPEPLDGSFEAGPAGAPGAGGGDAIGGDAFRGSASSGCSCAAVGGSRNPTERAPVLLLLALVSGLARRRARPFTPASAAARGRARRPAEPCAHPRPTRRRCPR